MITRVPHSLSLLVAAPRRRFFLSFLNLIVISYLMVGRLLSFRITANEFDR